ncbi:hypothetical protein T439DRAFT_323787 [Meredithblackwellia eburnea MCA 4105]
MSRAAITTVHPFSTACLRLFTSSSIQTFRPSVNCSKPTKQPRLPLFDYRRPFEDNPVPSVDYIYDHEEADAVLESIRSRRLSIWWSEGRKQVHKESAYWGLWTSTDELECLALADHQGVVCLHLTRMDHFPEGLKALLESESVMKQSVCTGGLLRRLMVHDQPLANPCRVLDLDMLAQIVYPELRIGKGKNPSGSERVQTLAATLLGAHFPTGGEHTWPNKDLRGTDTMDNMVNMTWLQHLLGLNLHDRLERGIEETEETEESLEAGLTGEHLKDWILEDCTWDYRDEGLQAAIRKLRGK